MFLAPRQLPPFSLMLDEIGARDKALAQHLGVNERTLRRWRADDSAPRPVMLALFYETRWGRSAVNCRAENDARMFAGLARAYERHSNTLRARVARLEAIGDFSAANAPVFDESVQLSLGLAGQ